MAKDRFFNPPPPHRESDRSIYGTKLLLVEGPDDIWFFDGLLRALSASTDDIQIIDYSGKDSLRRTLAPMLADPKVVEGFVRAIGIVQDADGSYAKAKERIEQACSSEGISHPSFGSFSADPKFGFLCGAFVLPNNDADGDLDTLLYGTAVGSPEYAHVESYAGSVGVATKADAGKRKSQVLLASKEKLCRGAGRGAAHGYFDLSHPSLADVTEFVTKLIAIS